MRVFLGAGDIVLEGPVTNVWWRLGDVLYTPALELGILAGVTRATLVEEAAAAGLRDPGGGFPAGAPGVAPKRPSAPRPFARSCPWSSSTDGPVAREVTRACGPGAPAGAAPSGGALRSRRWRASCGRRGDRCAEQSTRPKAAPAPIPASPQSIPSPETDCVDPDTSPSVVQFSSPAWRCMRRIVWCGSTCTSGALTQDRVWPLGEIDPGPDHLVDEGLVPRVRLNSRLRHGGREGNRGERSRESLELPVSYVLHRPLRPTADANTTARPPTVFPRLAPCGSSA